MALEVRPFGVKCNIACQYCYQHPERDAGNEARSYDMDKILGTLEEEKSSFTLFGGEPLLMPTEDLQALWAYGLGKHGKNGVQTNGVLVTERHIEMFERYKVSVGVSVDGPGELNDIRWAGTLEKTREATEATMNTIARLCERGRPPSLIITLHRGNASQERLPRFLDWLTELRELGVRSTRIHLLEVESPQIRAKYALSDDENLRALRAIRERAERVGLQLDMFADMQRMLRGMDNKMTCVYTGCDPYTTDAVQGLEGSGQRSNCGRTNKDGVDFVKAGVRGFERYMALYHTPQEYGGCKGCRFFLACKGQCPGTSVGNDWRNRTEHCEVLKALFAEAEDELLEQGELPLSVSPRRAAVEAEVLRLWGNGQHAFLKKAIKRDARTGVPA